MGVIYQLTFFAALALLAIVITIFVFAISLLGRAMEAAAKTEKEKLLERKENNAKAMADIKKKIDEAEGQIPKGLTKQLEKLEKRDREFERELAKIRKTPELLTVKGGVVPAASWLLGALILNGGAWGLSGMQNFAPITLWILGLAAIGYSIFRIYQSLKVIESVAVTSEEAALKRTVEAFKIAQKALEEERKPGLNLIFKGKEFPLHVKAGSEVSLPLVLSILKGDFAEDVSVYVGASEGFDFLREDTLTLPSDHDYPNCICMAWNVGRLIKGLIARKTITIKSPPTVGSFNMFYYIVCKGFRTEPAELEIIVE